LGLEESGIAMKCFAAHWDAVDMCDATVVEKRFTAGYQKLYPTFFMRNVDDLCPAIYMQFVVNM
jgi:hypothetical protein